MSVTPQIQRIVLLLFLFLEYFTGKKQIPKPLSLKHKTIYPFSKLKGIFVLVSAQLHLTPDSKASNFAF